MPPPSGGAPAAGPIHGGAARSISIPVKLSAAEYSLIEKAAATAGLPISAVIREGGLTHAYDIVEIPKTPEPVESGVADAPGPKPAAAETGTPGTPGAERPPPEPGGKAEPQPRSADQPTRAGKPPKRRKVLRPGKLKQTGFDFSGSEP